MRAPLLITLISPLLLSRVMLFRCEDSNVRTIKAPFQCKCCQLGSGITGRSLTSCIPQSVTKALPLHSAGLLASGCYGQKGKGGCSWGLHNKGGRGWFCRVDCHNDYFCTSHILHMKWKDDVYRYLHPYTNALFINV